MGTLNIKEVVGLEIVSLVDNSLDLLSTIKQKKVRSFRQWTSERYGEAWAKAHNEFPIAEHGFSVLIRILDIDKKTSILFDTGVSSGGIIENAKRMGIDLKEVEYIVLSHGHYDHSGGLISALNAIGKANLPVIIHEDMQKVRGNLNREGTVRVYPNFPSIEQFAKLVYTKQPYLIAENKALITGEIPRLTSYESGYLNHVTLKEGVWQSDPLIMDDRALVFRVKGKGLVIISGCAHAGIINTITYAMKITGEKRVYAVIGGFHLAGKENESRIEPTVKALFDINPKIIAPSHCTGWRGIIAITKALPEAFVWNSVGNLHEI